MQFITPYLLFSIPQFQMDPANPNAALIPTCATISSATSPSSAIATIAGGGGGGIGALGSPSSAVVPAGGAHPSSTLLSPTLLSPGTNTGTASIATSRDDEDDSSNQISSTGSKSSGQR